MIQYLTSLLLGAPDSQRGRRPRRIYHKRPAPEQEHQELGKWIWIADSEPKRNSYAYFRKTFKLPCAPDNTTIKVAADTRYKLYVNGNYVGKGSVPSGLGYAFFDTYDITSQLVKGDNVIALLVHHVGEDTYSRAAGMPGLLCYAEIETPKEKVVIASDETWKTCRATDWTSEGVRISKGLGFQEVYIAEHLPAGWNTKRFKEKDWKDAVVIGVPPGMPWGKVIPRQIPQLKEEAILPVAIVGTYNSPPRSNDTAIADVPEIVATSPLAELKSGSLKHVESLLTDGGRTHVHTPRSDMGVVILLDFGKEVFGNVEIGIAGSSAACIDISYGETLHDGHVQTTQGECKYSDRLILKKGDLLWQSFEPRAFRYLQLEFRRCTKAVALDYVRVNQTHYPVAYTGDFECSDELLNRIWQAGAYTTKLCMQDTFIDSPWRERGQWWADTRIDSRSAYYAFGDTALFAQALRQFAGAQQRDGMIPGLCPTGEEKIVPDFALLWVFSILDYFAFSGDVEMVRELYPNARRLISWFERYVDDDGLLANVPGNLFIDSVELEEKGEVTALNCLCYQALRVTGMLAMVIGNQNEAESYSEAARALKVAINKHLYSPEYSLYGECRVDGKLVEKFSRQANILAALFDIPDYYQKATILRATFDGTLPETETPYFASFILEALYSADRHQEALDLIRHKWGAMLKVGGNTFWESFEGEGNLCQGWSVCPTRDLISEYLGIKPVFAAHRFSVTPCTADLDWARGSINTEFGLLEVEWQANRNSLVIKVRVPQGLKVDVYPSAAPTSRILLNGKAQASRLVTVDGGDHEIQVVAAGIQKPPKEDDSLRPTPIQHVEVLMGIARRVRTSERAPSTRRRGERRAKPEETNGTEIDEPFVISETIESERVEHVETAPAKRSRRGGRRPSHKRDTGAETVVEVAHVEKPVLSPEPVQTAPEEHTAPARRSRRGGRRPSHNRDTGVEAVVEVAPVVEQPQPEAPAKEEHTEPAPAKKTRRGPRRKPRPTGDAAAPAQENAAPAAQPQEVAHVEAEAPTDAIPATPKKRRTYARRGGQRKKKETPESGDQGNKADESGT